MTDKFMKYNSYRNICTTSGSSFQNLIDLGGGNIKGI